MLVPVRCVSCGKVVGGLWEEYKDRVEAGENSKEVLDDLGLDRYCCRTVLLTSFENFKQVAKFRR